MSDCSAGQPRSWGVLWKGRRLSVSVALGALFLIGFGTAASATATSAPAPSPVFGIRPALLGRTSMPGGRYSYALIAGSAVNDGIELINFTVNPITLAVYGVDSLSTTSGALVPGQPTVTQHTVGAWLTVSKPTVTLLAHTSTVDHFHLSVPFGTPPGDYVGAVVTAFGAVQHNANGLALQTRAALLVKLRVEGIVHLALRVIRPQVTRYGSTDRFEVTVINHGNVLVALAEAHLDLRRGSATSRLSLRASGVYVQPGGHAILTAVWTRLPSLGHVEVRAVVSGSPAGSPTRTWRSPTLSLWFTPWLLASSLAGSLGVAVVGIAATNKWWLRQIMELREDRQVLAAHRAKRRRSGSRVARRQHEP